MKSASCVNESVTRFPAFLAFISPFSRRLLTSSEGLVIFKENNIEVFHSELASLHFHFQFLYQAEDLQWLIFRRPARRLDRFHSWLHSLPSATPFWGQLENQSPLPPQKLICMPLIVF